MNYVLNAIISVYIIGTQSFYDKGNAKFANFVMALFDNRYWALPLILALMQHDGAELHSQDEEFLLEIQMKAAHTLKNTINISCQYLTRSEDNFHDHNNYSNLLFDSYLYQR